MPRKAKDKELIKNTKKETTKAASVSKKAVSIKSNAKVSKNSTNKKNVENSKVSSSKRITKTSSSSTEKKVTKNAKSSSSSTSKKSVKESGTSRKPSTVKNTSKKATKKVSKKSIAPIEYYDLPTAYNKTVVKILAQTPSCLFVYWEISENDKLKFQKQYGEGFFEDTKPYLVIINETMNYSFEIEINDYANSWYIHINDSDCKYTVKLIRRSISHEMPTSNYSIDITSSNEIDSPNDHILFDKLGKTVFFKNVQSNIVTKKNISSLSFISNIGRIYNIYDLYKEIYKDEINGDELGIRLSSS